jgi:hypothetical protein
MHDFAVGVSRWSANVGAYISLLRDEYPPFSFDDGLYPVTYQVPYPERQSRWRLLVRLFALIPNQIVFFFVQIGWYFTSFIAWWAILFTGRYPRGLFNFSVGVLRWSHRQTAYGGLLRDEYPPYSTRAGARPGNEVVSAIIGFPLWIGLIALYVAFWVLLLAQGGETERFDRGLLTAPSQVAEVQPSIKSGSIRITIVDIRDSIRCVDSSGCFEVDVDVEKDGRLPFVYTPYFFTVHYCLPADFDSSPDDIDGTDFRFFIRDGTARSTLNFSGHPPQMCALKYFTFGGEIRFEFE